MAGKAGALVFFTVYAVWVCVSECVWVCELTASSLDTKMLLMTASGASEWKAEGRGQLIIDSDFDLVLIRYFVFGILFFLMVLAIVFCLATVLQISFGLIMR